MNADNTHTLLSGEVMLVEDNPSDLKLLSDILSEGGFHVRAAGDGELALRSVRAKLPDLIVLDVKLPGISGVEVCRRLRANPATRDVPVIFVSALSATDLKVRAFEAGGTDFVTKPFEPSEILARINTQLKMHVLQRRLVLQSEELVEEIEERLRAERQIAQLAKFPSENPNPVLRVDQSGRVLYANESSRALLDSWGAAQGELLPAAWRERITRVLASARVEDVEEACRDGIFSLTLRPILEMGYVSIYGLDITERKRAEEELRASEGRFRGLVENANDIVYSLSLEGAFVYVSPNWPDQLGHDVSEVLGKPYALFVHPDDLPACDAFFQSIISTGVKGSGVEYRLKHKDGSWRWHTSNASALVDDKGNVVSYVGISRDISERKRVEEALRESEEKFRSISASAQDAIIMMDSDGDISYWNEAAETIFGYSRKEVIGKHLHSAGFIIPARFLEAHHRAWPEFQETGKGTAVGKTMEVVGMKRNGEEFPIEFSLSAVRLKGRWHGIGILREITDRKRSEDERERLLHDMGERVKELRCMYGIADALRKHDSLESILSDVAALLPPGWHYPEITRGLIRFDGTDYVSEPYERTEWRQTSDIIVGGQRRGFVEVSYLERRPELYEGPFLREERNLIDSIARALAEAAERKFAEAELRRVHAESKQLLESIPSLLISVDSDDRVVAWNAAAERVFGIETKDAVGQPLDALDIHWDHAVIARSMAECLTKNRSIHLEEVRFKRRDGTNGILGVTMSSLDSGANRRSGVLFVARDITEQKILQSQLAQAQKLESIGQLAAGIAHEINTPTQFVGDNTRFLQDAFRDLNGLLIKYGQLADAARNGGVTPEILAAVQAAEQDADLEYLAKEIPQAITQSLEGIERVTRIVRAMKEFSHPGAQGKEAVDLGKAIESTVTVARNEWKYVAEMVLDFDRDLPPVTCLAGEFNQVILNIVINAAHAIADVVGKNTGEKGTITIAARRDGGWAEIRISDTGTGIPEEHRSKVFDHFFTTKEVGQGTGQGLAIAHSVITEKHGGSLTLESEIGKGTTFVIRLPIEPTSAAAEETEQHEEAYSLR